MTRKVRWAYPAILAVLASPAFAGYYATVTSHIYNGVAQSIYNPAGTACMLLPSQALAAAGCNAYSQGCSPTYWTVTAVSTTAGAMYMTGSPARVVTASISACTASPASSALPAFAGGVSDPSITTDGVVTGGGTTGSGTTADPLTFLHPQQAVDYAVEWFSLTLVAWAVIWGARRLYHQFGADYRG